MDSSGFRVSAPLREVSAFFQSAFTLIEVLVASAILAMLLVVFLSMSNYASQAWKSSQEKMEEFSTARVAMNRMRADFGSIILRPDLPVFPSDAEGIGFMTMTRGIATNVRPLSYVEYYTNSSNQLVRASLAYAFEDNPPFSTNSPVPAPTTTNASPLAEGVIGFKTAFLNKSGGWSTNYSATNSVGVRVSLLVISSERLRALEAGSLSSLVGAMESAYNFSTNATNSPESSWNEEIDRNTSGVDLRTIRSLRAFERLFFFPNAN